MVSLDVLQWMPEPNIVSLPSEAFIFPEELRAYANVRHKWVIPAACYKNRCPLQYFCFCDITLWTADFDEKLTYRKQVLTLSKCVPFCTFARTLHCLHENNAIQEDHNHIPI